MHHQINYLKNMINNKYFNNNLLSIIYYIMSYCNAMPTKKVEKVENFNNNSYMLLNKKETKKENDCSINYYNVLLVLGFMVFLYFFWMKYNN